MGLALSLPEHLNIAILSKLSMSEGSTYYAQGGISAVLDELDSLESHQQDTIKSGSGLCHEDIVELVVSKGKESIEWLISNNVKFSTTYDARKRNELHLTKEGGHSHRRVVHADDSTGRAIQTALSDQIVARSNVRIFEHHNVVDLITTPYTSSTKEKNLRVLCFRYKKRCGV